MSSKVVHLAYGPGTACKRYLLHQCSWSADLEQVNCRACLRAEL